MSNKRFIRDPNIKAITDLVSDEELEAVFRNTNFGHTDFRGLLAQGCIKTLAGWHQGHTLTCILKELGLVKENYKVTAKGRHYIWMSFKGRPGV